MIQIDLSLVASAAIFLITLFALNRILFLPMFRVIRERQARTSDVFDAALQTQEYQQKLLGQYEAKIKREKQAGYRLAESLRAEAVKLRQEKVAEAREQADLLIRKAREEIGEGLRQGQQKLRDDAEEIASLISERVLKRE